MSANLRSIGDGRCSSCGFIRSLNPSGLVRSHRRGGHGSPVCNGSHLPPSEVMPSLPPEPYVAPCKDSGVQIVLQLRGGRVFRCDVPMGIDEVDRADILGALEMLVSSLRAARGESPVSSGPRFHVHAWSPTSEVERYRCDCGAVAWRDGGGRLVSAFADVRAGAGAS